MRPIRKKTKRPNVWVVTRRNGFAVKYEGYRRIIAGGLTQRAAVRIARTVAREFGSELLVQGESGQIRFRDSHGSDPFPPKG
ncbi:MAG: hypothetical protein JWM95_2349 [Gemmatimonadetes bacterium]|nr:hypothetical protein [Gemmatimonadota bacterium]